MQGAVGFEKGLLSGILGFGAVAQRPHGQVVHGAFVTAHELAEGIRAPGEGRRDQLLVVDDRRRYRRT